MFWAILTSFEPTTKIKQSESGVGVFNGGSFGVSMRSLFDDHHDHHKFIDAFITCINKTYHKIDHNFMFQWGVPKTPHFLPVSAGLRAGQNCPNFDVFMINL